MTLEFRRYHRIMTFLPVGIHFADGAEAAGWGRILNLSVGGIELESHFPMRAAQRIFLTFDVEGLYQFQNAPARVVRVRSQAGTFVGGVSFEESVDRDHLREAIVFMVNRS